MILQRYIFRELLASFLFAFTVVLSVCLVGTMFQVFRTFPGLGIEIVLKTLPLATGSMATWVILAASCTSSTLVYARLAAENEITAMQTCGIHLWRIVSPALLLGLLLVGAAYPLNESVIPTFRHKRRQAFRESTLHALKNPPPGNQDFKIGPYRITYTDFRDGIMVSPTVTMTDGVTLVREYFAKSGLVRAEGASLQVVLTQPWGWKLNDKTGRREEFSAGSDFPVDIPTDEPEKAQRQLQDQPSEELWSKYFATKERSVRNPILLILHTRYASSLTPMLLVLVAMPIGMLVRRGSRLAGLGAAIPPLLIYFVSYFIFQGLGDKSRVPPLLAAYAPDLFLGGIAILLLWGASRR